MARTKCTARKDEASKRQSTFAKKQPRSQADKASAQQHPHRYRPGTIALKEIQKEERKKNKKELQTGKASRSSQERPSDSNKGQETTIAMSVADALY